MSHPLEIWAATPSPFSPDGRLNLAVVAEQERHLARVGVHGAFVAGTTGEFPSLTVEERMALLEAWRDVRQPDLGLAVQVGHTQLAVAQRLAAHAESCGVDMIAAVAPFYGETLNTGRIISFLADVAAAAPSTPFCFYHIPSMTGSRHRPSEIAAEAAVKIPTLAAVKFTDGDLLEFDHTRSAAQGVRVFFGRDELLPAALAFGADGVIGSLYNGLAPLAYRVADAVGAGDLAAAFALHEPFRAISAVADEHGGLGFVKELMNEFGPDAGPARLPWGPLDEREREEIRSLAAQLRPALAEAEAENAERVS